MACKHCGLCWKKDVSARELIEEINERKKVFLHDREVYYDQVWPKRGLVHLLAFMVPIAYLLLLTAMIMSLDPETFEIILSMFGDSPAVLTLFIVLSAFLWMITSMLYYVRKRSRLDKDFQRDRGDAALSSLRMID